MKNIGEKMVEEYSIDELDRKIITELQKEGRKSFREVAKDVDSTAVTVINRVNKMEERGIIKGYTAKIDYRKLGYHVVAAIELIVKGEHLKDMEKKLNNHKNVTAVYRITGDTDLLLVSKFKERKQLGNFVVDFLLDSNMVDKTVTHVAFDTFSEKFNIPLDEEDVEN